MKKTKFDACKMKLAGLLSKEQAVRLEKISRGICSPTSPPPPEQGQKQRPEDRRRPPKND